MRRDSERAGRLPGTTQSRRDTIESSVSLMLTMALAKRVDHAWRLVRRAAGHRQERGALERIFVVSVGIAVVVFGIWFILIEGPGPSLAPTD